MGPEEAPEAGGWPTDGEERAPRWQRKRGIAWGRVFWLVVGACVLGWAVTSPGGLEARLTGVDSSLKDTVSAITQNRTLEKASNMFDGWYQSEGSYPRDETQSQLDQDPNAAWGAGMNVTWCSPRDVVLTSLTVSGTVSRLLLDGSVVGDVPGHADCPADLSKPAPWQL